MSKLTILDWDKSKRKVDFVDYNRDRTACFIRDEQGARRAIDLWLPSGYGLRFPKNPIPNTPPDEICHAVLHLSSFCFIPQKDAAVFALLKARNKSVPAKEPFPLATVHPRKKWDAPDLDKKLQKERIEELRRLQSKRAAIEKQIAKLPRDEARIARIHWLPDPKEIATYEDTTLDDLKQGKLGLRAKVLQREFIEHHHLDPEKIALDFTQFCRWIRLEGTDLPAPTLATLAERVRYKIHFADDTGCWLEGIHERPLTTAQEVEDFDRAEAAADVAGDERMSCDEVCRALLVKRKGETKPMGTRGLKKLCAKARVSFEFPMRRRIVKKLEEHRKRQSRSRTERLKKYHRQTDT
jgi:hypothetical protein